MKSTLQIIFMFTTIWRLINIIGFGPGLTRPVLEFSALGLPIVVVFAFLGNRLSRKGLQPAIPARGLWLHPGGRAGQPDPFLHLIPNPGPCGQARGASVPLPPEISLTGRYAPDLAIGPSPRALGG